MLANPKQGRNRLRTWLVAGLLALLAACANQQQVQVERLNTQRFAPTTLVEVLQTAPTQPYVVLARLNAQAAPGTPVAQLLAQLQVKAAALGANAIIVKDLSTKEGGTLQFNPSGGQFVQAPSEVVPHLQAEAVRFTGVKP